MATNDTVLTIPKKGIQTFSWSDVSYSVPLKKEMKSLLSGMNGAIQAGEVVAIMGGSGAGKSTLLNTLAGRIGAGNLQGSILVDGVPRDPYSWRLQCAYVEQDDIMFRNLSVYETLSYSALLRLPKSIPKAEKLARVERIIAELGLSGCRNTQIGDGLKRGISGGERKRVSIGIELVTNPQLLFLDEPTSGLDAFNAFNVIDNIRNLATKEKKIILMTVHQPRTDILDLFDKIILLSAGKVAWFGSTDDALVHFASLGYPIPPKTNPSDFFLDVITLDQRSPELKEKSLARIEFFTSAYEAYRLKQGPVALPVTSGITTTSKISWPSSWLGEFFILLQRNLQDVMRDTATLGATLGQGIFLMLLIGFIFFKVSNDKGGVQNRVGVFFFIAINQTFGVVMPTLGVFPLQRAIIKRERAGGSYRSSSAYVAKVISSLPLPFTGALLLAVPVYWMVGLQANATAYFTFICIVLVHSFAANSLGLMIGSFVPNVTVGQILGPLIIVIFLLFGGQLLNLDQVPEVFKWIQWVSIIAYTNKAFNQNEFIPTQIYGSQTGTDILAGLSLQNPTKWVCVGINVGIAFAYLILGYIFFNRTSAPLLKLK